MAVVVSSLPFSRGGVFHLSVLKGLVSRMVFFARALCPCLSCSLTWPFWCVSSSCISGDGVFGLQANFKVGRELLDIYVTLATLLAPRWNSQCALHITIMRPVMNFIL